MPQRVSVKTFKRRGASASAVARAKRELRRRRNQQITRIPSSTTMVSQGNQSAFANRQRVTMRYSENLGMTGGGVGTGEATVWRANSINDPRFAVGGHQAMGHDQWAAMYLHYRVVASRISVQFTQNDGSTVPITCWVKLSALSTASTIASIVIEQGRTSWKSIGTFGNDTADPLVNVYNARTFFGPSAVDADHKAAFNADPQEDVYFHVGYQPTFAGDTGVGVQGILLIEYDCELTEPQNLGQS